jgi:hypothetical protein
MKIRESEKLKSKKAIDLELCKSIKTETWKYRNL